MGKLNLARTFKIIQGAASKRAPEILTGMGIVGMVATTVMAVKATPKAMALIKEEKDRQNGKLLEEAGESGNEECRHISKLKPVDMVKAGWKPYIPAVATGVVSVICLISSNSVSSRRSAALAAAYKLSETAFSEYREKVVETVGEKKEKEVRDKVAKSRVEKRPVSGSEVFLTEKGDALCYDTISGRYFKSDINKIKKVENEINRELVNTMYISLNEFYYYLGLEPIKLGDDLGWNVDYGLIEIEFSSQLANDGTPCLVMDYRVAPRYDYSTFT